MDVSSIDTNSKPRTTKLLVVSSLILAACSVLPAYAQELQVSIGPPSFEYEVIRGQIIEDKIIIINRSVTPLPFKIAVRNWTAKGEEGDIEFFENPQADIGFSPREWIELSVGDIVLAPREKKEVLLTIRVPETAEPGGHYVMINFESLLGERAIQESGGPVILPQIGSLVFLTVHVPDISFQKDPLAVKEFSIPRGELTKPLAFLKPIPVVRAASNLSFIDSSLGRLSLRIENFDIIHHRPEGEVQILNSFGQVVLRQKIPATTVLPGKVRIIPVDLEREDDSAAQAQSEEKRSGWLRRQLVAGRYTALVSVSEGDQVLEAKVQAWAFPWKILLLGITLASPLIIFMVKWRKRLLPAFLILFRGRMKK